MASIRDCAAAYSLVVKIVELTVAIGGLLLLGRMSLEPADCKLRSSHQTRGVACAE